MFQTTMFARSNVSACVNFLWIKERIKILHILIKARVKYMHCYYLFIGLTKYEVKFISVTSLLFVYK
ncbi:hypothetical protein GNIT_3318 [Glaciecola nitratireducens FR1064]|uniref:Uncharacterized protein n=1 Tax=Glaciecola nitratireducens (strain JCM 12485 / KCTC 12276 / FR1064) TaxID=1085623 RepID=G4QMZ3_GLANF|nr:hypothetical protein GNIT_3318 [Glaciecola nitratireducens FR1064]